MKEIDKVDTAQLLGRLEYEIDRKCTQLEREYREEKLKRTFIVGTGLFILLLIVMMVSRLFSLGYITSFIVYQFMVMTILVPMIFSTLKEASHK